MTTKELCGKVRYRKKKGGHKSGKEKTMNMTINFVYYLNSERLEQALNKSQSLNLLHPFKVRKSRLEYDDIG